MNTKLVCAPGNYINNGGWRQTDLLTGTSVHAPQLPRSRKLRWAQSEIIAISGVLDHALNSYKDSIWILTDSRSSIQYLKNWPKIMDSTGLDILSKLVRFGQRKHVCLQWIPSHVGVPGNEAADEKAGRGCDLPNPSSTILTHSEIHSFRRNKMNLTWRNPPAHHWYAAKSLRVVAK
ncbi:RNase H domain-containing protein [Trichonephila clavipes]|nr:RNase H domain-containing protein [Trichonephila clavipes]